MILFHREAEEVAIHTHTSSSFGSREIGAITNTEYIDVTIVM